MPNSFSIDTILNNNTPHDRILIDFNYPTGVIYQAPNKDAVIAPRLCFANHQTCKNAGVFGCYNGEHHFANNPSSLLISRNVPLMSFPSIRSVDSTTTCRAFSAQATSSVVQKQIIKQGNSSSLPMEVIKTAKAFPELCTNSSKRLSEQIKRTSSILPEQMQNVSKRPSMDKKDIFVGWRKHILADQSEFHPNDSGIVPRTYLNVSGTNPLQLQNCFPVWHKLSDSSGGTAAKEGCLSETYEKKRRERTTFSSLQLVHLERSYLSENRYLTRLKRIQLASDLGLTEKQVKVWFQNRRVRDKPKDETKTNKYMRGRKIKEENTEVKKEM